MSSLVNRKWMGARRHAAALVLACVAGLLSVAPAFVARLSLGDDYRGIPFLYQNDEDTYLARMREVMEGHWLSASPFFHEYKDSVAMAWPIGEAPYAFASWISRVPLEHMLVFSKFLLPVILFLFGYLFVYRLLKDEIGDARWPAMAAAAWMVLAYDPIFRLSGLELSVWSRPVNPIMGAIALFGVLLLLEHLLATKKLWLTIPIGILVGLMVWYPFSWAMAMSIIGSLWLFGWFKSRRETLKSLTYTLITSVLGSLPYVAYVVLTTDAETAGGSSAARFGAFFTRMPIINKTVLFATVLLVSGACWMRYKGSSWKDLLQTRWMVWSAAFLLAGWLVFNQQILTGRTVWPSHFVQYTKPLVFVVLVMLAWSVLRSWESARKGMMGLIIVASLWNGALWSASVPYVIEDYRQSQRYAAPIQWLREHAKAPCVVLVAERDELLTERIPAYTACDVYSIAWVFSGVPEERISHNFFTRMRLRGVLPEHARSWMEANPHEVRAHFFRNWEDLFAKGTTDAWFVEAADRLASEYATFFSKDFHDEIAKYRLDYVIFDGETPYYVLDALRLKDPEPVGAFQLYRFQP